MKKLRIFTSLYFLVVLPYSVLAQSHHYEVTWPEPETHYFEISLTTEPADGNTTIFQIPEWRPGSYELKNYAAGIRQFSATDKNGHELAWEKVTVNNWKVTNPRDGQITVSYAFYANKMDAGSSVLRPDLAYLNGVNLFMHVQDRYDASCQVDFPMLPDEWKAATAMKQSGKSRGSFMASNYHDFIDAPIILAPDLKTLTFEDGGVLFYIHYRGEFGAGEEGEELLLQHTQSVTSEQKALFGSYPFTSYHFLIQFVPEMTGHAVEHKNSSSYVLGAAFVRNTSYFNLLMNVISHEFFHLWNVKRIRPAALWPYDYQTRPYTGLHWFTEGVTSYYADLMLVRSGVQTRQDYYRSVANILRQMNNSYAAQRVSPYQSSMDSWLSGSDYANEDYDISYYSLGHRLGVYLDLTLRARTNGEKGLDDVFLYLFQNYYEKDAGVPENGIQEACEKVSGTSFDEFFKDHVRGTAPMHYEALLEPAGLRLSRTLNVDAGLRNLGVVDSESLQDSIKVGHVYLGSDAFLAGLTEGMSIVGVNGKKFSEQSLADFLEEASNPSTFTFNLANGEKVVVQWTGAYNQYNFSISEITDANAEQVALRDKWLGTRK